MYQHTSTCPEGPVTKSRAWWVSEEASGVATQHETDRPIRHELVARIRREIAAGEYDTPKKMEIALSRLLGSLESSSEF